MKCKLVDVENFEGRTWGNKGLVEDIATGSAAGPAAAFLFRHGLIKTDEITLHQGRFLGRPSEIRVIVDANGDAIEDIRVSADVVKVADILLAD